MRHEMIVVGKYRPSFDAPPIFLCDFNKTALENGQPLCASKVLLLVISARRNMPSHTPKAVATATALQGVELRRINLGLRRVSAAFTSSIPIAADHVETKAYRHPKAVATALQGTELRRINLGLRRVSAAFTSSIPIAADHFANRGSRGNHKPIATPKR